MRAVVIHRHGGPEVLSYEEVPRPEPGPGEALIRVRATSLNRLDLWARSGPPGPVFPWKEPDFPIISGSDCAGEVAAVGAGCDQRPARRSGRALPESLLRRLRLLPGRRADPVPGLPDLRRAHARRDGRVRRRAGRRTCCRCPITSLSPTRRRCPSPTPPPGGCWSPPAELRSGESVLVLGVGGGVGSAALVIARRAGATVYAAAEHGRAPAQGRRARRGRRRSTRASHFAIG